MAHAFQSSRGHENYVVSLRGLVAQRFGFFEVAHLPPEAAEWNAHAKHILMTTRGARGLSLEMEEHILALDSGNWKDDRIVHYYIGEASPNQCRGDRGRALKGLQDCIVLSCGGM
eukprot:8312537-Pyramimonas_sp.AAC.1